jgi:hypothetical protein
MGIYHTVQTSAPTIYVLDRHTGNVKAYSDMGRAAGQWETLPREQR